MHLLSSRDAKNAGQPNRDQAGAAPDRIEPQPTQNIRHAILQRAVQRSVAKRSSYAWLLGSLAIVYVGVLRAGFSRAAVIGLGLLAIVQLAAYANKMHATLPISKFQATTFVSNQLKRQDGLFRVISSQKFLPDHLAQSHRAQKLQGYDPLPLSRYARFFAALTAKSDPTSVVVGWSSPDVSQMREPLLDLANVRLVVMHSSQSNRPPDEFHWSEATWNVAERSIMVGGIATTIDDPIFENTDFLPRAFVVGQAKVLPTGGDAIAALAELRPRDEALMDAEFLPPGPRAEFAAALIAEYTPNRVVIEADLAAPGYLVLSDTWYPGWTATDNGNRTSVLPANLTFRAVPLAAGKHQLMFQYRPTGLGIAGGISLVVWGSLIGSMLWHWLRRWR